MDCSKKTFEEYLACELNKDVGAHFDENGNSSMAVVLRMNRSVFSAFAWECGQVYGDIKYTVMNDFKGFGTPIGWFVQVALLPILAPILPFLRTYTRYKSAIDEYKEYYEFDIK
ncbi:TMhelix containing protein [Vibrio phage 1.111.B._10N.286.45.E6]|nr:TMhelix containing protein [Vibrio phage 1.111.A._10N.286.45.E6]AUR88310.1 TMhelix containing protein [Vibrio phage 1.111.B._10N.286.45.E6]